MAIDLCGGVEGAAGTRPQSLLAWRDEWSIYQRADLGVYQKRYTTDKNQYTWKTVTNGEELKNGFLQSPSGKCTFSNSLI